MFIETKCQKCGATIQLNFGSLTKEEAVQVCRKMNETPRECPGGHVELGGFWNLWRLEDALHRAYDLGEGKEELNVKSDREFVAELLARGVEVYDGGLNTVPELELPSLHSVPDLEHISFGNFRNATHVYLRCDSPRGTRFYERRPNPAEALA
jgi:hypothetical protein